jgi:hypothetical protein
MKKITFPNKVGTCNIHVGKPLYPKDIRLPRLTSRRHLTTRIAEGVLCVYVVYLYAQLKRKS